jgi:hypothetical protein
MMLRYNVYTKTFLCISLLFTGAMVDGAGPPFNFVLFRPHIMQVIGLAVLRFVFADFS